MTRNGNRMIEISKAELINQIKKNKETHIKEYAETVKAYKAEALKQLGELQTKAEAGEQKLKLELTEPVNLVDHYDRALKMFEWEIKDVVELSQQEFNDYVLDEASEVLHAKFQNASYFSR